MGFIDMSLSAGIIIFFIFVLRISDIRTIPKATYPLLWKVTIVRMLIPFEIPVKIDLLNELDKRFIKDKSVTGMQEGTIGLKYGMDTAMTDDKLFDASWLLMMLWIIGMISILAIHILKYVRIVRLMSEAVPTGDEVAHAKGRIARWIPKRHIRILSTDRITSPLTAGVFRPKIILPQNVSYDNDSELDYILIHEIVHIVRKDNLWKIIALIAAAVHWFNPLAWLMYYFLQRDMEVACDEKVISLIGGTKKAEYALTLIRLAEKQSEIVPLYSSFGKNLVEERIVYIMKHKKITCLGVALSLILILLTGTTFLTYAKERSDYNPLYDPSVNKMLYISEVREKNEKAIGYFPVNENGYTYGPDLYESITADLVSVNTEDTEGGVRGYCYERDLVGPSHTTIEEAFAFMKKWKDGREVLVYESDGETILGIFRLSTVMR